jgi:hypothetical protein
MNVLVLFCENRKESIHKNTAIHENDIKTWWTNIYQLLPWFEIYWFVKKKQFALNFNLLMWWQQMKYNVHDNGLSWKTQKKGTIMLNKQCVHHK